MFNQNDCTLLRDLARRHREIAELPIQQERIARWKAHNDLRSREPMILIFPEGASRELVKESDLRCEEEEARGIEYRLRMGIYEHEHWPQDKVTVPFWDAPKAMANSGWGVEAKRVESTANRGAWTFDPVIKSPEDLKKLRHPVITHHEAETNRRYERLSELFGDILPVRMRGRSTVSFHMMNLYTRFRGLEEVMLDMYEEPEMLHEAMAFIEDGLRGENEQCRALGLLEFNNDNSYQNSGGNSWTDRLPLPDADPETPRLRDLWASAEAQEMAQVSPEMHEEFVLQYEKRLLEPFGLTGYGCCEDLTRKLDRVLTIPHIRRISISPWADVEACAEQLGDRAIFSWKPHPSHLVGGFDEAALRSYIGRTLEVCRRNGCVLEMVLKDTHTCEEKPERFDRWCAVARELCDEAMHAVGA